MASTGDPSKTAADPAGGDRTLAAPGPDATLAAPPPAGALRPGTGTGSGTSTSTSTKPAIPDVEIEDEIGRGGMGVVYRGRQPYLDRRVAVKILLTKSAPNPAQFVDRFRREAKILANLHHPHIVACHQAGTTPDGDCYLVMEFIDGPNLRDWCEKHGALQEANALAVARDVARALEHAHAQGIIHRDVKPENVLLQKMERAPAGVEFPFVAKLVDLGLARPEMGSGDMKLTAQGAVVGTPATMAPEQFDDPDHVDLRADIYGLGCVLYTMLTGRSAFEERTITQLMMRKASGEVPNPKDDVPGLRDDVAALARDMLARGRDDRPQTYAALIGRIEGLLTGTGTGTHTGTHTHAGTGAGGGKIAAIAAVIALAAGAAIVVPRLTGKGEGGGAMPAGLETLAYQEPAWGGAEPLLDDAREGPGRLRRWDRVGGAAVVFAAPDDRSPGVVSNAAGSMRTALGPGPWRVDGAIELRGSPEAGLRVDLDDGGGIALAVQPHVLGAARATIVRFDPPPGDAREPSRGAALGDPKQPALDEGRLKIAVAVVGEVIAFLADDRLVGTVPLRGSRVVTGLSLYNTREAGKKGEPAVAVYGLAVRRPK